jgi:putative inorganic carbon (hco3(-)) transporter
LNKLKYNILLPLLSISAIALLAVLILDINAAVALAVPFFFFFAWLAFAYPTYYVSILAALVPFSIQIDDIGMGLGISLPTEPLMVFFLFLLIVRRVLNPEFKIVAFKHPVYLLIALYLFWYAVTTATSTMPVTSLKSLLARFWFIGIFFFFLVEAFQDKKVIKHFLFCLIAGGFMVILITLFKHAGEGFVRSHSYTIMRPFFNDHGSYAAFIAFFVPVLAIFIWKGAIFHLNGFTRILLAGVLTVFLIGIQYSFTRATWLSLVAVIGFGGLIWIGMTFKQFIYSIFIGVVLLVIASDTILYELSRNKQDSNDNLENHLKSVSNITTDASNLERINRWYCAVDMFLEKPLFGFGPYTYTFQYASFQRTDKLTDISTHSGSLGNAHSEYFMHLSEMGLPGFAFFMGFVLASIFTGIKLYRNSENPQVRYLALAILLGLVSYYFHGLMNNYSEYDKISVPMWGFLAILVALDLYHNKQELETKQASV